MALGGLAGAIYEMGKQMRDDHLLDLQNRKEMQDRDLKTLENWATNPGIHPETQAEAQQALIQLQGTPLDKFKHDKATKTLTDIIANDRQREYQQVQQASRAPQPNTQFQAPPMPMPPVGSGGIGAAEIAGMPPPPQLGAPVQGPPGMPASLPGIAPPGPNVPGAMNPFIDPQRALQGLIAQLEAKQNIETRAKILEQLAKPAGQPQPVRPFQLGNKIVDATGKVIYEAPAEAPKPVEVNRGATLVDPKTGKIIFAPAESEKTPTSIPVDRQVFEGYLQRAGGDVIKANQMMQQDKPPSGTQQRAATERSDRRSEGEEIADAIMRGDQPPTMTGLYRVGPEVRSALAKKGYNLTQAQNDYDATKRWIGTQNSQSQLRIRQAAEFAFESLDIIDQLNNDLSKKIPRSDRFPLFNKASLAAAKAGALGAEAQQVATNMDVQIADLQSELASVYKGGNSPTDMGLKRAQDILSGNWTHDQLKSAVDLARKNLRVRLNSIKNVGVAGTSGQTPFGNVQSTPPNPPAPVRMKAPNGQERDVPPDQVDHYKSLGATIVNGR